MFTGEVRHQLDAKNRIRIPAKYKAELGEGYALVKGHDCVCVYPGKVIEKILNDIKETIDPFSPTETAYFREYSRGVRFVEEDNQGRILVDKMFIEQAKLKKDIVTTGVLDHLEIISAESDSEQSSTSFADMMELFSKKRKEKNERV